MTNNLNNIFKAFLPTKGKVPTRRYTDPENWFKYEEVKNMPSFAGLLSENAILVDIDDDFQAEIVFKIIQSLKVKCRVHRTTRGIHAFFLGHSVQHTKTHVKNAISIETDYKMGTKNGITILKLEGVNREVIYETEEIEPLPCWLYPVKGAPDFLSMENGDGRNNALYQYILTLQASGLTKEQSRTTIEIINRFILKDPLPARELETILRDESFPTASFYDARGKLQVRKFEEHFCNEVHALKIDSNIHIYDDGVYVEGDERIRGEMLDYLPDLTYSQRNEILNRTKDRIRFNSNRAPANIIAFRNGVYDVKTKKLSDHNPEYVVTNLIDWDYNPDAYSEVTDKTLNKLACNDATIRALLEEMVGYTFYRRNELGKMFLLLGDNSNGKSTYLSLITCILGRSNVSALNLQELDSRFKTAELFNKLANVGDDIPETWVPDASMLKKLATGDRIIAERKGQNPFEFEPYAKLLFSANVMPRIDDKTGAVKRRIVPVPFRAVFSPDDPDYDPRIKDKLMTEESIQYLIHLGLEGLDRVIMSNKFSTNADIENELKTIDEMNNPIIGFIEEAGKDSIINKSTKESYDKYREYCIESGLNPVALNSFVRQINGRLGTVANRRMIQGTMYKIFEVKE